MGLATRVTVAGAAALGLVLVLATPAAAHNWVVSSTPAEGELLTELPEAWELVTSESLLYVGNDEVFGLLVRDADGLYYGDGCVEVAGATMSATPAIGAPGAYELVFAFISADGHPLTGEVPFEWAPAGEFEPATGHSAVPRCGEAAETPEPGLDGPVTAEPERSGIPADVWWIGGAVLAIVAAIVAALALARRSPRS